MRMRLKQNAWMLPAAVLFGLWLSWSYVNPYGGVTALSSLVCQLSGARGDFSLDINLHALLDLTLRLLPSLIFQALAGISLYRHTCTASVYVFSRMPNRLKWYGEECGILALQTLLYQALVLAATVGLAAVRWTITDVSQGIPILLIHLTLWSLWTFAFTLGVNLLAIYVGSSTAFAALAGVQVVCIGTLAVLTRLEENPDLALVVKRVNPVTCLILNWQTSRFLPAGSGIYWEDSLVLVLSVAAAMAIVGGILVQRHDLLISDTDGG